jgi:hypothetical protein
LTVFVGTASGFILCMEAVLEIDYETVASSQTDLYIATDKWAPTRDD